MRLVEIESEYLYTYTHIERVIHHNSSVRLPVYSFSHTHQLNFFRFCTFAAEQTNFSICHQESPFSQPILNRKMGATSTDNDKMDTGGEETTTDKEEEIDPSKTLINNVSLIKKSVESKGEPRFIASVFRQVRFRFSDLKPSSSSSSSCSFVDLSFSLSFFLSLKTHHHEFFTLFLSSMINHNIADAHGENEIDQRSHLRVRRGRFTERFGVVADVETVFERECEEKNGRGRRRRKIEI